MDFRALIKESDLRTVTPADLQIPSLPADGGRLLHEAARRFSTGMTATASRDRFHDTIEIHSYPHASGSWYADRDIRFLVWKGDLVIEGDLIDDHFETLPLLIVHGNLTVRNWLRGGMASFVGGSVRASGFIVGHYNDSALFVGGDLAAAGFIPRVKPYPDLPDVAPHQIAGAVAGRRFQALDASAADLRAAFADEVLVVVEEEEQEQVTLDERAILERSNAGLAVWR